MAVGMEGRGRGSLKRQTPAPDMNPKEPLVVGIGWDTRTQKKETANAKLPTTFQPGREPALLLVKEQ